MKKILILLLSLLLPLALIIFYYQYYSADDLASVQCGFHHLTGWQCPGCGGQRSFHYLLHGDILSALRYNAVFVIGLPFLIYLYYTIVQVYFLKNDKYSHNFMFTARFGYIFLVVMAVFFIIRNIPAVPFIYLSPP